jgi:hypothetical protein
MDISEMLKFKWSYSEKLKIEGLEWEVIEHENYLSNRIYFLVLMYNVFIVVGDKLG